MVEFRDAGGRRTTARKLAGEDLLSQLIENDDIHAAALDPIVERARIVVPVETGRLRESIRRVGKRVIADAMNPGQRSSYALAVERRSRAYMTIALRTARLRSLREVKWAT